MILSNWLVFCSVSLLVTFTPGPAVLLAISNSISIGQRRALICSLGNAAGLFVVSAAAMAGMGVVLSTSAEAFLIVKLAGAGYLVYLGIRQWRLRENFIPDGEPDAGENTGRTSRSLFGQGVAVALTNPKAILFFSALFPQFLTTEAPIISQFAILTLTFAACAMLSHLFYIRLARNLKTHFSNPRRIRLFHRVSGTLFILLGLSLLRLQHKAS